MPEGELNAMDPQSQPAPSAEPALHPQLRLAGRVFSWVLVAAATVVALCLLAVSIGPRVLPYQALVVRSGSMSPTIPTGSIVFYKKRAAADVKVGDIIVFAKPGQTNEKVTHRVFRISNGPTGRYFTTKGDANGSPDDWRVPAVGTGWVAAFHVPVAGYALVDLQSTTARLLLLLIPAVLLGLITLYEIWRDRERGA
jgi:signal peptidase